MIQVNGLNNVLGNLNKYKSNIYGRLPKSLNSGLEIIRNDSISYLNMLCLVPPGEDAIRNISNWNIQNIGIDKATLICNSKHASIQEFGSFGGSSPKFFLGTTTKDTETQAKVLATIKKQLDKKI